MERERDSASRTSANVLTPPSELLDSMVQTKVGYRHGNSKLKGTISPGEDTYHYTTMKFARELKLNWRTKQNRRGNYNEIREGTKTKPRT